MCQYFYLLAFGSNVGDRSGNISLARKRMETFGFFQRTTDLFETSPLPSAEFDVSDHGPYLNGMAVFLSRLAPLSLYGEICRIEDDLGHPRDFRWRPRAIDVDILATGLGIDEDFPACVPLFIKTNMGFVIPHYGLWERDFLLDLWIQGLGWSVAQLERMAPRNMEKFW